MKKKLLFFGIFGLPVAFCVWLIIFIYQKEHVQGCDPMPGDFSEKDLTGTWIANRSYRSDTLIIKGDGTYKQIVHFEEDGELSLVYESVWQPWYISLSEENYTYLHLEGMRFCGMNPQIPCDQREGDGYDFCRDETVMMINEGILIVLASFGDPIAGKQPTHYYISLNYPLGSENSWSYYPDQ